MITDKIDPCLMSSYRRKISCCCDVSYSRRIIQSQIGVVNRMGNKMVISNLHFVYEAKLYVFLRLIMIFGIYTGRSHA